MSDDLVTRAKTLSAMINLGERIAWGQDTAMIDELAARIEADAATIARLEGERERLALAICGGEDVPGYANAQPVEALEKVARDNAAAAMWQIDRTMKAEAQVAALVEALEAMRGKAISLRGEQAYREFSRYVEKVARAAIAAAKEGA